MALLVVLFALSAEDVQASDYHPDIREFSTSDDLDFPTDRALALADQATLEFWVAAGWQADPGYDPVLLYHADSNGLLYVLAMLGDRSGLTLQVGDELEALPFSFADERLHHVALIKLTDEVVLMVDGQVVGTFTLQILARTGAQFRLGSAPGPSAAFEGALGGLRIWEVAVQRAALIEFALQDPMAQNHPHPDLDALRAYSDLRADTITLRPGALE